MALGTAPRRLGPRVWVTRSGNKLTAGQAQIWEGYFHAGHTDGQGHFTQHPSVVFQKPAAPRVTPPAVPARAQVAEIQRQHALGKISTTEAQDQMAKLQTYGGRKLSKAQVFPAPHGAGGWAARLIGGLTADIAAAPAGGVLLGEHPIRGAKQMGTGIYKSYKGMVQHPGRMFLQHPDQMLLNLLPVYGAAGKSIEALGAARAAEGGAVAKTAAASRAAVRMTPRRARTMSMGGVDITAPEGVTAEEAAAIAKAREPVTVARFSSRNPATQRLLARRDQTLARRIQAGEKIPSGRLNVFAPISAFGREFSRQYNSRLGRALAPAQALERFARGKDRLTPVEEEAARIVARNHNPETYVQAHLNAREKAIAQAQDLPSGHPALPELVRQAEQHGVHAQLAREAGALVRNPTPKLQTFLDESRAAMEQRQRHFNMTPDEIHHSLGKAHDEIAALAEGRPSLAQQIDAAYAKIPDERQSSAHLAKQARVARLQGGYDRAIERSAVKVEKSRKPLTREEAQARLDTLEAAHNQLLDKAAERYKGLYPNEKAETARRNVLRARYDRQQSGKTRTGRTSGAVSGGRMVQNRPITLAQEYRGMAQDALDQLAEKNKSERWAQDYIAQRDEISQLRNRLTETAPGIGERQAVKGEFGRKDLPSRGLYDPHVIRYGASLSVAKDELHSYEKGLATRQETGRLAQQEAEALHRQAIEKGQAVRKGGGFYLSDQTHRGLRAQGPAPGRSVVGFGPPRARKMHSLTGEAFRSASYRTDVARLVADASREGARTAIAREFWPKILSLSKDSEEAAGGSKYAIPMRMTQEIPNEYREAVMRAPRGDLTREEAANAAHDHALRLQQWRFPGKGEVDPATSTLKATGEKVRWVDRRLVSGALLKPRPGSIAVGGKDISFGDLFDTINAVPKVFTLAKPGYALNRVQQAIQNLSQQGVFLRASSQYLKTLKRDLNPAEWEELRSLSGTGRSRALAPETGTTKRVVGSIADFMGKHTDDASRLLALAHELRTAGLDTSEKVRAALRGSEADQVKLESIATRVNQEAIPFGKMSEAERRTISRAFFFWPWTRAALEWTARFPGEHPFQAYGYGQVGGYGKENLDRVMGPVPEWARGLIPVGGGRTINLGSLNTPQTVVDTGQLVRSFGTKTNPYAGTDSPVSEVGPGFAALYGLASGTVRGRGAYAPLEAAVRGALGTLPIVQMFERMHKPPTSIYPGNLESGLATWAGGAYPRKTNKTALNIQGRKEQTQRGRPAPSYNGAKKDPHTGRFVPAHHDPNLPSWAQQKAPSHATRSGPKDPNLPSWSQG